MEITQGMICLAIRNGACEQAVRWLTRRPRTVEGLLAHGVYVGWCLLNRMVPDEYFEAAITAAPSAALQIRYRELTDYQLVKCAAMEPMWALAYRRERLITLGLYHHFDDVIRELCQEYLRNTPPPGLFRD